MVNRIYDRVAQRYDEDWSGLYASARRHCIRQILEHANCLERPADTLDLGVGTGNSLYELRRFLAVGKCTGFDLSAGMLERAERKLPDDVRLIRENAIEATEHLQPESNDLVLCHFLLSFVDADRLFETAYRMLRPGAMFSLATSTRGSLRESYSGRFGRAARIVGVQRALNAASTPADHVQCLETLSSHGFEIVDHHLHRQPVRFANFGDVRSWALHSGWAASLLADKTGLRIALGSLAFGLAKIFMYPLYPVDAVSEISVVLARKPGTEPSRDAHPARSQKSAAGYMGDIQDRDSDRAPLQSR